MTPDALHTVSMYIPIPEYTIDGAFKLEQITGIDTDLQNRSVSVIFDYTIEFKLELNPITECFLGSIMALISANAVLYIVDKKYIMNATLLRSFRERVESAFNTIRYTK